MRLDVARRLLGLLRGQRRLIAVSVGCRVLNLGLGVVIPVIAVAYLVSVAAGSAGLGTALAVLVTLALAKGTFRYLEQYTGHAVAFRLLADLRNQVFRWLRRLEPGRLHDERTGDLVSRVSGDIDRVEPFYAHTIAPLVTAISVPSLGLVGLGMFAGGTPVLALGLFFVVYLIVVPWIGVRKVAAIGPDTRRRAGETAAAIADVVQGAGEIAVLGAGDRVLALIDRSDQERAELESRLAGIAAVRTLAGGLIAAAAVVAVTVVGVVDDLEFRTLAMSIVLAWTVWAPIRALEQILPDTEQALAAAARLFALEDLSPQPWGQITGRGDGEVHFESVTVRSGPGTLVDGVDLAVGEGTFLGVVGPSGSGKTTLVQALVRHRDPDLGVVRIGGIPGRDLSPGALAATVALVPQRPDVFHGTIASNLRIAKPEAGDDELRSALARAFLLDWVDGLEHGLETPVGERGASMSGGQVQRLALARAFLRDPAVLALDEATSELDAATEEEVMREVYAERGRRTLIVVAHRMEIVVPADLIAVMDSGCLVELGSHDELLGNDGLYAALWSRHQDLLA